MDKNRQHQKKLHNGGGGPIDSIIFWGGITKIPAGWMFKENKRIDGEKFLISWKKMTKNSKSSTY